MTRGFESHRGLSPVPDANPHDLERLARDALATGLPARLFEITRDEDLGPGGVPGDITAAASVDTSTLAITEVRAREGCVVAGLAFGSELVRAVAPDATFEPIARDGDRAEPGASLATLRGPARPVLAAERPLLNLLSRLSGVATRASEFVALASGTRAAICDTRKTTPGWRVLEKYAVVCGGGVSHRAGLHDAVLFKDNHAAARAPGQSFGEWVALAAQHAREAHPFLAFVEVECDTLGQYREVLALPRGLVDMVLLDNMTTSDLRRAVRERDDAGSSILLEASGGVTLDTARDIAQTGVDRISVGSITHGARSVDLGLDAVARAEAHPSPPLSDWADGIEAAIDARENADCAIARVAVVESTGSTQDLARRMVGGGPGLAVVAGRQTEGRGRLGRVWHDTLDLGLAMTLAIRTPMPSDRLALVGGVALVRAANALVGEPLFALRWPNDAVHCASGRKLAGVLIERAGETTFVGVGMNIAQRAHDWPSELAPHVISLRQVACPAHRLEAALALLGAFEVALTDSDDALEAAANGANALAGQRRTFRTPGGEVEGVVDRIGPDGSLVLTCGRSLPGSSTSLIPLAEPAHTPARRNKDAAG